MDRILEVVQQNKDRYARPENVAKRAAAKALKSPPIYQEPYTDGTSAVMALLGIRSKQGVWRYDPVLKPQMVDGRRAYDMDVVKAFALTRRPLGDKAKKP